MTDSNEHADHRWTLPGLFLGVAFAGAIAGSIGLYLLMSL